MFTRRSHALNTRHRRGHPMPTSIIRGLLCLLLLLACQPPNHARAANAAQAQIVVTLPPLAALVRSLDATANVHCLLPPGSDPHAFHLSPKEVLKLRHANLLVRSSFDDGHWSGIRLPERTLDLWPKHAHRWLLPTSVRRILPHLAHRLEMLAPQRKHRIEQALAHALSRCEQLDRAFRRTLAPFRRDGVIMQHNAWAGVFAAYQTPVLAILESSHHGDNIRPHTLERALARMRAHPGVALIGNRRHANRGLQWLDAHRGKAATRNGIILLDPLGDCGKPWSALLESNLNILAKASKTTARPGIRRP